MILVNKPNTRRKEEVVHLLTQTVYNMQIVYAIIRNNKKKNKKRNINPSNMRKIKFDLYHICLSSTFQTLT